MLKCSQRHGACKVLMQSLEPVRRSGLKRNLFRNTAKSNCLMFKSDSSGYHGDAFRFNSLLIFFFPSSILLWMNISAIFKRRIIQSFFTKLFSLSLFVRISFLLDFPRGHPFWVFPFLQNYFRPIIFENTVFRISSFGNGISHDEYHT